MNRPLVIFDVEGTLIDNARAKILSWHKVFHQRGFPFSVRELEGYSGRSPDEMIRALLSPSEAPRLTHELKEAQRLLYRERYLPHVKAFSGVPIIFERTKRLGYSVVVVSSCPRDELWHYMNVARITGYVHEAVSADDIPGASHLALLLLAVARGRCTERHSAVLICDTPYDAATAARAGIKAVGVSTGCFSSDQLLAAGCTSVYLSTMSLLDGYFKIPSPLLRQHPLNSAPEQGARRPRRTDGDEDERDKLAAWLPRLDRPPD